MIRYEDVEVRFGDFVAIPKMNLHIKEGDFFTFLGPSGCGKTTALRVLAGLVEPSHGKIHIDGNDVTKLPSDKRQLGMVFQNYALFPTMTVYENIAFGLKVGKLPKDEITDRVKAIAKEVNLTDEQLTKNVAALSGGQQQRVAIARALILRPKILLLDEPLSNLDAKLRHSLRIQLKEMQQHFGITSVYVTHDQEEALTMSDAIAVINFGKIEQVGTPREVYSASKTEFVCTFIGDSNKFDGAAIAEQAELMGVAVDPSLPAYVRVEKTRMHRRGDVPSGFVTLNGKVTQARYQGTLSVYVVDCGAAGQAHTLRLEEGVDEFKVGDEVTVSFNPVNVMAYPPKDAS